MQNLLKKLSTKSELMRPADAIAALKAFQDAIKGSVVSATEVSNREAICATCPMRRRATGIPAKLSQTLGIIANRHRVSNSIKDYKCGVCGCSLMLIIPATDENQHVDSPEEAKQRPALCWLK
jgi:hypothetical protein